MPGGPPEHGLPPRFRAAPPRPLSSGPEWAPAGASAGTDAPAKINLFLRILAREEGGFHCIETVFCGISLADRVEVTIGSESGIRLEVTGSVETGPPSQNLAVRAAEAFLGRLGKDRPLLIRLRKRTPAGAGLGGGSSDAAAVLRLLDRLHPAALSREQLLEIAAELGSDVPFFLAESPLALAWSRGERLLELPSLPARPLLIVHPPEPLPTPEAYTAFSARRGSYRPRPRIVFLSELAEWERVAAAAHNDFEEVAAERIPRVGEALRRLRRAGAIVALLSGSGSAVFGLFRSVEERDLAAAGFEKDELEPVSAETLEEWPTIETTSV